MLQEYYYGGKISKETGDELKERLFNVLIVFMFQQLLKKY